MGTLEVVPLTWAYYKKPPLPSHSKLTNSILKFLLTLKTQFESYVQLQAQMEETIFVCVYNDGEIASDSQTRVSFASVKTIMIRIHRCFGLSKLIHIIMDKANKDGKD